MNLPKRKRIILAVCSDAYSEVLGNSSLLTFFTISVIYSLPILLVSDVNFKKFFRQIAPFSRIVGSSDVSIILIIGFIRSTSPF